MIHKRRAIPVKVLYSGDIPKAKSLRGIADSQLVILEDQLKQKNLSQGRRKIEYLGGAEIECVKMFGVPTIRIHVPTEEGEDRKEKFRECYCWPCFSQGYITAIHDVSNVSSFASKSFSVGICVDSGDYDRYISLENICYPLDCAQFILFEPVLVTTYPGEDYKMCRFMDMPVDWFAIAPINPAIEKAPALKWWRISEGSKYFKVQ